MKNKVIIAILIVLGLMFGLIVFYYNNDCYNVKISFKLSNYLAKDIDNEIASEVKDNLSQIEEIKEIITVSRAENCSVYCKIHPFILNKTRVYDKIQNQINKTLIKINKNVETIIDDNFKAKYQTFIVVSSKKVDYKVIKKYCDNIYDELLGLKISSKILKLSEQKPCVYIYYKNSDLVKYDISLEDIKNTVEKNNVLDNSMIKTNLSNSYNIKTNGAIKDIDDIKNIALFYKNKNFSTKFKDVFKIEEKYLEPPYELAYFDNKKAEVFAVSKKAFYPDILLKYKLKKLNKSLKENYPDYINIDILSANNLNNIEIYFKNRTSIYNSKKEYEKIYKKLKEDNIDDTLFLIGLDCPKISNREVFFEKEKNKITILSNKINTLKIKSILNSLGMNFLNKTEQKIIFKSRNLDELYRAVEEYKNENSRAVSIMTDKTYEINYEINNFNLNDYKTDKKEIINSLKASIEGLNIGYFYNKSTKTPIILQNLDDTDNIYYYSKNYKTLIPVSSVAKNGLKEGFFRIVRKNENFIGELLFK